MSTGTVLTLPSGLGLPGWTGRALVAAALLAAGMLFPRFERLLPEPALQASLLAALKLLTAAAIGYLLTAVHRGTPAERGLNSPLEHAQTLICVAGSLVVMLIGDSLARAVGIIGGASLIRFRTPIDDPKDAALLFLLMGVGMAAGMGQFALAGLATLLLAAVLPAFNPAPEPRQRSLTLQIIGAGPELPSEQIERVLVRWAASFEQREISRGERPVVRYLVSIDPALPLGTLSQELLDAPGARIHSLAWDTPKKERLL